MSSSASTSMWPRSHDERDRNDSAPPFFGASSASLSPLRSSVHRREGNSCSGTSSSPSPHQWGDRNAPFIASSSSSTSQKHQQHQDADPISPPPPQIPPTHSSFASTSASTATNAHYDSSRLQSLIISKEKELHDINHFRIHTLESLLKDRDRALAENNEKIQRLKTDFQYNLHLIEERDAELDRADAAIASLQETLRTQVHENEDMRQALTEAEQAGRRKAARIEAETEENFAQREQAAAAAAAEREKRMEQEWMRRHTSEMESMKREYEGQMLAREDGWRAVEEGLRGEISRLEERKAALQRAVARGEAHEVAAREVKAKLVAVVGENKELRMELSRVVGQNEEKMQEIVGTLKAAEAAFEQSQKEAAVEQALRDKAHEEAMSAAVQKKETKVATVRERLLRAEERAARAEKGMRDLRKEMEERVMGKMREGEAAELQHAEEIERKEVLILDVKTSLWEAEAEGRRMTLRVGEMGKMIEGKEREMGKMKEQIEHLRTLLVEERKEREREVAAAVAAARAGVGKGGRGGREEELETSLRNSEGEAARLRAQTEGLQEELRREKREADAAATAAAARTGGAGRDLLEEGALVEENVRLRTAISEMRHEMERLKFIDAGRSRDVGRVTAAGEGDGGNGESRTMTTEGKWGGMLLLENRRLREENKKLSGTCDKLMGISSELNARLNKLSTWAPALEGDGHDWQGRNDDGEDMEEGSHTGPPARTKKPHPHRALQQRNPTTSTTASNTRGEGLFLDGQPQMTTTSVSTTRRLLNPPLASARETQGQKDALSRLKSRKGAAAASLAAAKQKVRNYNER
ncbi:hypothetical protein VYU27_004282 [Nannochloropsis oceanica]